MLVTIAAVVLAVYVLAVLALVLAGRRTDARALAGFVPDCAVLLRRLAQDPRVARGDKRRLVAVAVYLALPIDLVPDFIPVAGQLDDAILVALVLLIIAAVIGLVGYRKLKGGIPPVPENTIKSVRRDIATVKGMTK